MKTTPWAAVSAAVLAAFALFVPHTSADTPLPAGLSGELSANPKIVKVGESPKLTWKINYPSVVKKYVKIIPPGEGDGSIEPLEDLYVDVRILGQGVTVQTSKGFDYVTTEALMNIGSTSNGFKSIFKGINPNINPGAVISLSSKVSSTYTNNKVKKGNKLRFGGQYFYNPNGTLYKSNDGTDNVRFLVSGDTPPSNIPDYNAPSLESFIRPYLDPSGKVKIGPMDVIVFMELTHNSSQKRDVGYDLQDLVLLVTFRKP